MWSILKFKIVEQLDRWILMFQVVYEFFCFSCGDVLLLQESSIRTKQQLISFFKMFSLVYSYFATG